MITKVEHLLVICISTLEKYLFSSATYFLSKLYDFFAIQLLIFKKCILDIGFLSNMCFINILSHFIDWLPLSLCRSYLTLYIPTCSLLLLLPFVLWCQIKKKIFTKSKIKEIYFYFILRSFKVSVCMFKPLINLN